MRLVIDFAFNFPDTEGWDQARRNKVMEGVAKTLSEATMYVGRVKVEPHEFLLYDFNTAMPLARQELGMGKAVPVKGVQQTSEPNTLCIVLDVDTRTEFV